MRPTRADAAITAAFAALFLADIAHHAPWRDELLAWMIARTSATPLDLFRALHVDGHPGLWHALLWPLTRLTADPLAMKAAHAVIGLGIILLLGLASPFVRWQRALLLANYFILFEDTVISRNYGLGLLVALLFAWSRAAAPAATWRNAALLALLANTHAYCTLLAALFALEYLIERLRAGVPAAPLLAPALLAAAGIALAIATVWPAPDISREIARPLVGALSPGHFVKTAIRFAVALAPLRLTPLAWTFLLDPPEGAGARDLLPFAAAAAALVAAAAFALRRDRAACALFLAATTASIVFGHLVHAVAVRHWGIVFTAFLACLWMARLRGAGRSRLLLPLFALGALGGAQSLYLQWRLPFSQAQETARWIAASPYAARPLIGVPDAPATAVAALLARDITMPECACTAPRAVFTTARDGFRRDMLPDVLARLAGPASLLVSAWPLTHDEVAALAARGLRAREVAAFAAAWTDETFSLYALDR
ncbi:MAG: hypothetical protein NT133_04590 [Alphaproteobacteria bacterium]|nr:hypothetical protein [Alphaproteobacteria bacterium]